MNVDSNNQSSDSPLSPSVEADLLAAEADQATDSLVKQCLGICFRFLRRLLFVTIGVYILMIGFLALFENRLVYPGAKYPSGNWDSQGQGFTEVEFTAADDTNCLVGTCP